MAEIVPRKGDQVYRGTYFDEEGVEIRRSPHLLYGIFEDGVERELHFMQRKHDIGAASYEVRLLRPKEVSRIARDHRREEIRQEVVEIPLNLIGINTNDLLTVFSQMLNMNTRGRRG